MERVCKFYKESTGEWYIDLPEWTGSKSDLQMILGADTLLDLMAQGQSEVSVRFSTEPYSGSDRMAWTQEGILGDVSFGGAMYRLHSYKGTAHQLDLWLCDVTKFVFGEIPRLIFFNCETEV